MAKVDNIKTFQKEDFDPEYKQLIDKLSFSINPFMEQIVSAFNKNIDITNLTDLIIDVTVSVDIDGIPTMPTSFKISDTTRVIRKVLGMAVINHENLTDDDGVLSQPYITFSVNKDLATIKSITGLPVDKRFKLTVRIYR